MPRVPLVIFSRKKTGFIFEISNSIFMQKTSVGDQKSLLSFSNDATIFTLFKDEGFKLNVPLLKNNRPSTSNNTNNYRSR